MTIDKKTIQAEELFKKKCVNAGMVVYPVEPEQKQTYFARVATSWPKKDGRELRIERNIILWYAEKAAREDNLKIEHELGFMELDHMKAPILIMYVGFKAKTL